MVTAPNAAPDRHAEAVPGRVIAERYRLIAPVGTGGMATVWRAQHLTLDQPVALKFIEVAGMDVRGDRAAGGEPTGLVPRRGGSRDLRVGR